MTVLTNFPPPSPEPVAAPYDPQAIANYIFPPALEGKLVAEQKWTPDYARRVLTEYRRFIHLAATAGHEVTPSQVVDEAWHLHLTFSRDYWERLVPLLPAPLHHEPAAGEPGDAQKYAAQYRRTLDDYRREFGEDPPADIWRVARPPRRARFLMVPAVLGSVGILIAVSFFFQLSGLAVAVLGGLLFLLIGGFAAAAQPQPAPHDPRKEGGSGGGGSCGGGAGCGYTGGDACDSSGDGGGGDSGSCGGGGCGGGGE